MGGWRGLDGLVGAVLAAGDEALTLYRQGAGERAKRKADASPVTEADEAVEIRLRRYVAEHFAGAAFVGEEQGESQGAAGQLRFIVDPIDGTRAFMRGLPTWSVLLGIEYEGDPVVGVAYLPAAGDLFVGAAGHGARVNGRPATLSHTASLSEALVAHGGLNQFTEAGVEGALPVLARGTFTQRGFSDFANYGELLRGRADAVVDPGTQAWDLTAAAVLVREAGGRFTSFDGEDTVWGGSAVASNGRIHDALLALLGAGRPPQA